jgi:DNA/RNA endonuclease YhcR with UshA esterase domain
MSRGDTVMRVVLGLLLLVLSANLWAADEPKRIAPEEAAKHVDTDCLVEMKVRAVGMAKSGDVYFLNSQSDFRSEKNFTVLVGKSAIAQLKKAGVMDVKEHFLDRTIQVRGTVKLYKNRPEIVVNDADRQLKILEKK